MRLLICAATGRELAALAPAVPGFAESLPEMRTVPVPAGVLKGHVEASLCITGVGPINAACAAGMALGQAAAGGRPFDAVLCAGLAGAYALETRPLRSLCRVHEEIWPEYGLHDGISVTAGAFRFPLWQKTEQEAIRDRLPLANVKSLGDCPRAKEFIPCRSLTVAGVSASANRVRDLWNRYHAELENMEGFAVAYACARVGIPCVEIRSVSNKAGPRAREEKDFPGALAALKNILPALNLL